MAKVNNETFLLVKLAKEQVAQMKATNIPEYKYWCNISPNCGDAYKQGWETAMLAYASVLSGIIAQIEGR